MKAVLLLIPTKRTDEINWTKPLNAYLVSVYGSTLEFQSDIAAFHKLRLDLKGAHADATGIAMHFRYYLQLELLDLRMPAAVGNRLKRVTFTWYDAFSPAVLHEQFALPFEKASVLFNLAALLSRAAVAKYSDHNEELFKEAVQYLSQAAGVLQFVGENFMHAPLNDLAPTTIQFLVKLCLAQSQEIFTLKVVDGDTEQKKNSLVARLCMAAARHYDDAFAVCSHVLDPDYEVSEQLTFAVVDSLDYEFDEYNPELGERVRARLEPHWVRLIQFKAAFFRALAFYYNGLHLEGAKKYGEAIASLERCAALLRDVASVEDYELMDSYKYHKDAVEIKLKELHKDNDLVYHELVPGSAAEPKPMDLAKATSMPKIALFSQITEHNYAHFLKNVVPVNIHELLSYYSEEKLQFLRNELDEVEVLNEELSLVLEYHKLPQALANVKEALNKGNLDFTAKAQGVDAKVLQQVAEIAQKHSADKANRAQISSLRKQIYDNVSRADRLVGGSVSFAKYREDLIKVKKSLYDATNLDSTLFALVDENSSLYETLGKGPDSAEFKLLFKASTPETEVSLLDIDERAPEALQVQIKDLEDILHDLNVLRNNKAKLVASLKEEIHRDDISEILMLNSKLKLTSEIKTTIFPAELRKFEVFSKELDRLIDKQTGLIRDLTLAWEKLSANPEVKRVQKSQSFKDDLMRSQEQRISSFYNSWTKYSGSLEQSASFYTQLHAFSDGLCKSMEMPPVQNLSLKPSLPPKSQKEPDLIYNQPSAYLPDMYSYFSGSG